MARAHDANTGSSGSGSISMGSTAVLSLLKSPAIEAAHNARSGAVLHRSAVVARFASALGVDHPEVPGPRHALQRALAAILECDAGSDHEGRDRARDQDLAGIRFGGDSRRDMDRDS